MSYPGNLDSEKLSSLLRDAKTAIEDSHYPIAADSYRTAADLCEQALLQYRCAEARALLSAEKFQSAIDAADKVINVKAKHPTAWYIKGTALFKIGKLPTAKQAFLKAADYETDLSVKTSYKDWAIRCDEPKPANSTTGAPNLTDTALTTSAENGKSSDQSNKSAATQTAPKPAAKMTWYQSGSHVNMDIYAKNVNQAESKVTFNEGHLSICLKRPDGEDYVLNTSLAEKIDPAQSSWNVSRVKVEVRMKKLNGGITWKALDIGSRVASAAVEASTMSKQRLNESKVRQQQWDSFAEKELKDYDEDDSSMALFRTIYKDADEDTKRAMLKSYTESGGQVLSTNWDDVKKKKVVYEGSD